MISAKKILALMPEKSVNAKLASYLDYLATLVAVDSVNCFHVYTATHLIQELNVAPEKHGDKIIEQMQDELKQEIAPLFQHIPNKEAEVVLGMHVSEVMRKVNTSEIELVALGERNDRDTLLAKQFIRHISGNFLFVPDKAVENISHMLVPIDLSKHSAKVLQACIQFKKSLKKETKMTIYHSYEMPAIPSYNFLEENQKFLLNIKDNARLKLQGFVSDAVGADKDEISEIVLDEVINRPDTAILKYAVENQVDLLVMGTKGHSILDGWLGSTIERVLEENENIPMLVIK